MCTIIFIAKIALQYQIKPEFHVGFAPWIHYQNSALDLMGTWVDEWSPDPLPH
jgi:hypothetical protein